MEWRRTQKLTVTTINHGLRTLRRMLHLAVEWGFINKVPKIKLLPGEKQREAVLNRAEIRRFEKEPGLIGKLVPFMTDTGLRRREVCNLLWRDVSENGREIHVTKGKTKFARRRIPLTDRAVRIWKGLPREGEHVIVIGMARGFLTTG